MKARDVVGRRIVEVFQERVALQTTYNATGQEIELAADWMVTGFLLDNGAVVSLHAVETDIEPIVTVSVLKKPRTPKQQ